MKVVKRSGKTEEMSYNKITARIKRSANGLKIDCALLAQKVINGVRDGISSREIDDLAIQEAANSIGLDPVFGRLAANLLSSVIEKEVAYQGISSFSGAIKNAFENGLINEETMKFVEENMIKLDRAVNKEADGNFEYFGLKTVYDRYLLKNPQSRQVIETPQYFFLRVACGLAKDVREALELYGLLSSHSYMASTPTLFNSGTRHQQMSSCYLLDSPPDSLDGIYKGYADIARLSKFAGGIGVSYSRVRADGSLIKGTNGHSNGIVPWLKTLDSSVAAVNQGGKRKGAACVYIETWHADIEDFLELRDNTGDHNRRTHHINIANWVPDLFMKRLEKSASGEKVLWSLFDPAVAPQLVDLYGDEFETEYERLEQAGLYKKQVDPSDLYARMMKTLAQTGNGWMNFKDAANRKSNQTKNKENVIHLSNLCTEILEVTSNSETAVCNLGSINLSKFVSSKGKFDFKSLEETAKTAIKYLDRVIDINFYPIPEAKESNLKWRPVGLGIMGLQDVFFKMRLPFDSAEALDLSNRIQEVIYFSALRQSCDLAKELGAHPNFKDTRAADGVLQHDLWGVSSVTKMDKKALRDDIKKHGLRNSLMIAIAPTATIASIVGVYECIEPQVSNLFKRETLSGEFMQVNRYLIEDLKRLNLWNEDIRIEIVKADGSIQNIEQIPGDLKLLYRTAWELKMKSVIDLAAGRAPFIDQSQSLNLYIENPKMGQISSMYAYAWKRGLKTTYYLRSRGASKIGKTVETSTGKQYTDSEAVVCSLENPEACEACQ
ncbi:ribonucleoside-diphosphate reductase subunit alpha [Bdellovibrio sp. BCCA]|uniref:ribonucleoside-diphosphate reductase subunit alpha n=1 Tax=Bdellovibrio sp. BCCA TaxID=3136281 RepID=UPI0030F244B3